MSALTDPPALVYPFVPMAPDLSRLTPDDYRAALEYYDPVPLATVAWFQFPSNPGAVVGGRQAATHVSAPGKQRVRFCLSVGAAPAGYGDQYVALWFLSDTLGGFYQCAVRAGTTFAHGFTATTGFGFGVLMQLCRPNTTTDIAPLSVWLGMATAAIPTDDGLGTPTDSTGLVR